MQPTLKKQLTLLILGALLITLAYQFTDRAIVFWAAEHQIRQYKILDWYTYLANVINVFVFLLYPLIYLRWRYQRYTRNDKIFLCLANSVVITIFLKDILKIVFGRYWPDTWTNNNPSLLHDNAYGFHWFHQGSAYSSFPSGHVAITTAAMSIIWIAYPRLRWFAVLIILGMIVAQVGLYYHFLSDALAGGLLGLLVAQSVVEVSNISLTRPIEK